MENSYILILGCFDTKSEVFAYLRKCILQHGQRVMTLNTGTMGSTDAFPVDIEAEAVAEAAGTTLERVRKQNDRGQAVAKMGEGAAKIIA
ncbi:Tm-1-like ATP-binding domain-containing protein, partial [Persicitalea sp.]|uniref:Tm-1-like ATP-binding domain-containing protein n=1 Tax=Persicitalea sp. TaxID=3100273 RepID=UPI0035946714